MSLPMHIPGLTRRSTIAVGLVLFAAITVLSACTSQTALILANNSECGTIHVELTNTQTSVTETYDLERGQTLTIPVAANITYTYFVDYGGEDSICKGEYRGQVLIPVGASQTFNLTAATPTPAP